MDMLQMHDEMADFSNRVDDAWKKTNIVRGIAKKWRDLHEKKVRNTILENKSRRKSRDHRTESEVSQLVARQIPFDYLARDWLEEQKVYF